MHGFTEKEATVACKQLGGGFKGNENVCSQVEVFELVL